MKSHIEVFFSDDLSEDELNQFLRRQFYELKTEEDKAIKSPEWISAEFSLRDVTVGWANSNSSVRYDGNFQTDRHTTLTGVANCDIYREPKKPLL